MSKIIGLLRKLNIRNRIAAFLIIGFMIFLSAIILFSTYFSQSVMKRYLYDYVESVQKEIISSIELTVDGLTMLTVQLKVNQDIYNLFDDGSITGEERDEKLRKILKELLVHPETVGNIVIISEKGGYFSYNTEEPAFQTENKNYITQLEKTSTPVWGEVIKDSHNNFYIPYGMRFRNFYTGQQLGYLIVYLREAALLNIYGESVSQWGYSYIVSRNGYVLSHPQRDIIGKVLVGMENDTDQQLSSYKTIDTESGKTILATYRFSERLGRLGCDWKIVSAISYGKLFHIIEQVNRYLLIFGVTMVLIATSISVYIAKRINKPVQRLKTKLNEFGKGRLDVFLDASGRDEIWELENSFYEMVDRIRELIENNNKEKEKQRELELIALQAQINPHFLYNTLDAIGWIAKLKKQEEIEQLVMALARFFRLSLHKGDKFITVEEEIQLVQSFVQIEQMRSPGKFDISYHIPEEIKSYKILKIVLQPLVENAVKHGISQKRGKGTIRIQAVEQPEGLKFEVEDDGVGFDIHSRDFTRAFTDIQHHGYGLRNVDERIKLEYGPEYGLRIKSSIGEGTTAEIYVKIMNL